MAVSGIYNYHPKVDNPNKIFYQMESGEFQKPFYFGGSQVPINLGTIKGSGFRDMYKPSSNDLKFIHMKGHGLGLGLKTTHRKNDNIRRPKLLFMK